MKKQVLILASVASMIDQFNIPFIKLLIEMGYKVHVACNFKEGSTCSAEKIEALKNMLSELDVPYHQIDFKRNITNVSDNLKAYRQLLSLMKENKYEFIHCHSPIGGVCGRLAGRATNTKVIYTAHGFHFFKGAPASYWLLFYHVERLLSRYTDVLITINEEDYNLARKSFKARKIEYVQGVGVNLSKFAPQTDEVKSKLRNSYGYTGEDFILIYVGELSHRKHQDLLIKAVSHIKDDIPNLKLLLVGMGDLYDDYAKLIRSLGVEKNVQLLGFREDVPELMMLSDAAVSSSRQEGLPVNVMEAMAVGLPLVVSNSRGNRDLVVNNKNGFVFELDNIQELSNAIIKLYKDKELRMKFRENSLSMIQHYSVENVLERMRKIYQEI